MPVYTLPEPLCPVAFRDNGLYKAYPAVNLHCALAASGAFSLFPKPLVNTARCDVPRFFAARYFSSEAETAVREFEYRWPGMRYRVWRGTVKLDRCIDLADEKTRETLHLGPDFLRKEPYFPWHFVTACSLTADCDSVRYRSFRGAGLNYAVFRLPEAAILEPFQPKES